jgi:uncharacterized membrane protein (UPF0127 family)
VVSVFPNHSKKILKSQKDKGAWQCYEFNVGVIERLNINVGDQLELFIKKEKP